MPGLKRSWKLTAATSARSRAAGENPLRRRRDPGPSASASARRRRAAAARGCRRSDRRGRRRRTRRRRRADGVGERRIDRVDRELARGRARLLRIDVEDAGDGIAEAAIDGQVRRPHDGARRR